ncbi:MAG TPA: helix-turn-helix domain-containing protein [Thermodesulfobacteriota bacterium]|nr:helix-turn-helix domain-containing protein [Thermodesulfobacteriota bacterium]
MKRKSSIKSHQQKALQSIGSKIRTERKKHGLSLEALANRVGVSKMTLQRIETGATAPSIVLLTEVAFHLKRPVEALIRDGNAKVVHLKKDQQETLDRAKKFRVIAPRGLVSDRVTLTYSELAKDAVINTHTNKGYEWAFLIEGSAVVDVAGSQYHFKSGDAIFYDAHVPHSIQVKETCRYVGLFLRDE